MPQATGSERRFYFVGEAGGDYWLNLYCDDLHIFQYGRERLLVASRVVPHSSTQYGLYMVMKQKDGGTALGRLLPATAGTRQTEREHVLDVVTSVTGLVPAASETVPRELIEETSTQLEEMVSTALARRGFGQGLGFFSQAGADPTAVLSGVDPIDPMRSMADVGSAEAAMVSLGDRVYSQVKEGIRSSLERAASDHSLARLTDYEFEVQKRLYGNPAFLGFVRSVLDAEGSYSSPLIRDFLSFYAKCFNLRLSECLRGKHYDPDLLRKRLEGIIGRQKGIAHYALDYHELTVLGYVREGDIPADSKDPDSSGRSWRVSPECDSSQVTLSEVRGDLQRYLVRKFVEHIHNIHHNVKVVVFIDEAKAARDGVVAGETSRGGGFWTASAQRISVLFPDLSPDWRDRILRLLMGMTVTVLVVGIAALVLFIWTMR